MSFLRNCQAGVFLALRQQIEYRFNFALDVLVQPMVLGVAELCIWSALVNFTGGALTAQYSRESYLIYGLWAAFIGRISENWRYEMAMHDEIESGSINALLLRPISFYEFYLWQYLGYKGLGVLVSVMGVYFLSKIFGLHVELWKIAISMTMLLGFWVFQHTIGFSLACLTFAYSRASAFTITKNFILWMFMGLMFPLDLLPSNIGDIVLKLPFAAGVYYPVGFISGRIDLSQYLRGYIYLGIGIVVAWMIAAVSWRWGLRKYTGTGA